MANLYAELVTPDGLVFEGEVKSVLLPGIEGDMTVMPGHAPVMTMLHPGMIFAIDAEGKARRAFVRGGFVEITGTKIMVLAESSLPFEEVTPERIDEEILHFQTIREGSTDEAARNQADVAIARLHELKGHLRL